MKSSRIRTLKACAVLLLSVGLLFGCKPIFEKKPLPPKDGAAAPAAAPAAPAAATPAPVAPAATPTPAAPPAEPVTSLEEVKSIESLGSGSAAAPAPASEIDDGNDVVTVTPAIMRKVQQALVNAGFNPGPVDGVSGAKTVSAIESFQKQNGIPAGKITKKTLRALGVDF
ncbi:peptidoglycan-binding domain-containing protein [Nitrosomonas sp.]|uniref:peptidoglycan-binding domain-containing protein n=1 Tax=Nitrosomonas sp. TaxID=42353 RepID=UPI0025EF98CD|nr:peptidoglycan-binding domain-containing protein [Nitrosomonas sp.]